jgi:CheY-like chemotaxis protein
VVTVSTGKQAIEEHQIRTFDLILMDCHMPEMDGLDATREIRRREGSDRHTLIVALTASALPSDRQVCLSAGTDDFVTKPVRSQELQELLTRYLVQTEPILETAPDAQRETEMRAALKRLESDIGLDLVRELKEDFKTESNRLLQAIRTDLANGDLKNLARRLHTKKGCSGTMGPRRSQIFASDSNPICVMATCKTRMQPWPI